jgi:hypothetical protein
MKKRKLSLHDAVLWKGETWHISTDEQSNVCLRNFNQCASGYNGIAVALSKVNQDDLTDMYGNKVQILKTL